MLKSQRISKRVSRRAPVNRYSVTIPVSSWQVMHACIHALEQETKTLVERVQRRKQTCSYFGRVSRQDRSIDASLPIMNQLFLVFVESIDQASRDKRYFLVRLKSAVEVADAFGDFLQEMNGAMDQGGGDSKGDVTPDAPTILKVKAKLDAGGTSLLRAKRALDASKLPKKTELGKLVQTLIDRLNSFKRILS